MNEIQRSGLRQLVEQIHSVHVDITEEWRRYADESGIIQYNQRSTKVKHILNNPDLLESIVSYTDLLRKKKLVEQFILQNDDCEITSRVKNHNSIMEKIDDYCNYREQRGEVSVNKCFNDLFGIRIVLNCEELTDDDLKGALSGFDECTYLEDKNVPARLNAPPYVAKHIYFKMSNSDYRWELQIWKSIDAGSNHESHRAHRYKYRGWESNGKGRV